ARHADGTERYAIELRLPDVGREGEPDLEGRLRREVVEAERGEEADDALGDALRHDGEVVVLADLAVWQRIEAAGDALQLAALGEAAEVATGQAVLLEVVRGDDPALLGEVKHGGGLVHSADCLAFHMTAYNLQGIGTTYKGCG